MKSIASAVVGATIAIASALLTYRIRKSASRAIASNRLGSYLEGSPRPPKEPKERKS